MQFMQLHMEAWKIQDFNKVFLILLTWNFLTWNLRVKQIIISSTQVPHKQRNVAIIT